MKIEWIPYEELNLSPGENENTLVVSLPWMSFELENNEKSDVNFEKIMSSYRLLRKNPGSQKSSGILSAFLDCLSDFPLAYALPKSRERDDSKVELFKKNTLKSETNPKTFLAEVMASSEISKSQPFDKKTLEKFLPKTWQWNVSELLLKSINSQGTYDPTSLYCALSRRRLIAEMEMESASVFPALEDLLKSNEPKFFKIMYLLLIQTLFVTKACDDSIRPAVRAFPAISGPLKRFLKQETGHWKLVNSSLQSLKDFSPPSESLFSSTVAAMACLEYGARHNATALCSCVGSFEGSAYDVSDPLVSLLMQSSRPEAANGIHRHFLINKGEKHSLVGRDWSLKLPSLSKPEAIQAIYTTEILFHCLSATQKLASQSFCDLSL